MRVAYLSPLPPQTSGIADYSVELLPFLGRHFEIDLYSDLDGPADEALDAFALSPLDDFPARYEDYDLALYQLGNNATYHGSIYRLALDYPGVVVLHEYLLHHLVHELTAASRKPDAYVEEMRYAYGPTGERAARRALETGAPLDRWAFPLFERTVDRSLGVLVHNETTRRRILRSRPLVPIAKVPHHLALGALSDSAPPQQVRRRFGIADDAFLVASFGFMTPPKRLEICLEAFSRLRESHPRARYLLVGDCSPYYDLDPWLDDPLASGVLLTGRLPLPDLLAAMQACDVAINLRYPSGGETSGTLMRLLGLGKPVIVNRHGSFGEIPPGCCAALDLGDREVETLTAYLEALADDPSLRQRIGDNARHYMAAEHTLDGSARGYATFLDGIATSKRRLPPPVPPLAPYEISDVGLGVRIEASRALADFGVSEADNEALGAIAEALLGLGLGAEELD